ncbi:EF-hand domain-containing protein [Luteimonas aquatica]|uniref:EF-hand domain-containing protein n=1 Tax=Luteimonas aquatica TaxID=450364 RepID=UPI001F587EED|nr:EF-hand domain-containing protein [Luteimonas aquatica]
MIRKTLLAAALLALASGAAAAAPSDDAATSRQARMAQLDKNGDGQIDRAEAAAVPRLAEHFDQIDADKDGKLSAQERAQAHRGMRRGGAGKWREALDTDKDGRISQAEAAANPRLAERFAELDTDRNGYLDREDFRARMAKRQAECFVKADADKDGKLSPEEFAGAREACHGPRGRAQGGAGKS